MTLSMVRPEALQVTPLAAGAALAENCRCPLCGKAYAEARRPPVAAASARHLVGCAACAKNAQAPSVATTAKPGFLERARKLAQDRGMPLGEAMRLVARADPSGHAAYLEACKRDPRQMAEVARAQRKK